MATSGDIVINKSANTQLAKLSKEEIEKNKKLFDTMVVQSPEYKPTNTEAIIAMAKNDDGSIKWTFDNIYQNKNLASVAKDYYGTRDNETLTDREAIDKFISDRTWKQSNTLSIGKEYKYITGNSKVTLFINDYPNNTQRSSPLGPFTVTSTTDKVDTRARGRLIAVKIENESTGETWRYGTLRVDAQPDGRR